MKSLKNVIRDAFSNLFSIKYQTIEKHSLEEPVGNYMKLLVTSAIFASITSIFGSLVFAAYYDIVRNVTIEYWKLINYSFGVATSLFFLYLFVGTFGAYIVSVLVRFISGIRTAIAIKMVCLALTPVFLFGWVHTSIAIHSLLWSAAILIYSIAQYKKEVTA